MTKITKTMWKAALEGSLGTQVDMSERLSVSESAISQYMDRNPDMAELFEKKRLNNVGRAEHVIFKQLNFVDHKNPSAGARIQQGAATLTLKSLGKNRGWVERTEQEISGEMKNNIDMSMINLCQEYNDNESGRNPKCNKQSNKE